MKYNVGEINLLKLVKFSEMALVKIVVTIHNNKNSFLKILKMYLQLKNALIKFVKIKAIVDLKMETKKQIKSGRGKLYLLTC